MGHLYPMEAGCHGLDLITHTSGHLTLVCMLDGTSSKVILFLACFLASAQPTCASNMRGQVNIENVGRCDILHPCMDDFIIPLNNGSSPPVGWCCMHDSLGFPGAEPELRKDLLFLR